MVERVRQQFLYEFAEREARRKIYERVRLEERALAWKWFREGDSLEVLSIARSRVSAELDELGKALHDTYFERG